MTKTVTTTVTLTNQSPEAGTSRLAEQTAYSDPGAHGALLDAVPPSPEEASAVARNVIVHYRNSGHDLPKESLGDIHARRLSRVLELDQGRHGRPLAVPREPRERVQGCCRDHTLFVCAVLRQHGIPARGRVGFASYFEEGYHHDHVVAEAWEASADGSGGRWRRFDPELTEADGLVASPMDLSTGPGAPFVTAAEAWRAWRAGELDAALCGPGRGVVPDGPWFLQNYVLRDLAHRHGDELLLWDGWGAMAEPGSPLEEAVLGVTDEVAALLVAADAGDGGAEAELGRRYAADERLHPGARVLRHDPLGTAPPCWESLRGSVGP